MPSARYRAVTSAALPAPNITVISTGLPDGKLSTGRLTGIGWASAGAAPAINKNAAIKSTNALRMIVRIIPLHQG